MRRRSNGQKEQKTIEEVFQEIQSKSAFAENGCIEWTGRTVVRGGRGVVYFQNKSQLVTRFIMEQRLGKMLSSKTELVCHTCDNPKCINAEHLFIGSPRDNLRDCAKKGRMWYQTKPRTPKKHIPKTHCPKGHELTYENTYIMKNNSKTKACRICKRLSASAYRQRKRSLADYESEEG